uniref:Amidohydrolase-related domain-containing protein n=1 Tax=Arcella intermedia TaxID=1963864 RepID=A0A6B2L667_9EUKA
MPAEPFSRQYEGDWITAGLIDIHNHGIGGSPNASEYWFHEYTVKMLPKYGTTSCLATLTFPKNELQLTKKLVGHLQGVCGKVVPSCAVIEGIHAEGPIIRTSGGLPEGEVLGVQQFSEFLKELLPSLKIMTISPSLEKTINFERLLIAARVVPALGHDVEASEDDVIEALRVVNEQCPVHITHLFNVSKFHHREIGLSNIGMISKFPPMEKYQNLQEPSIELIGDFIHVHPLLIHTTLNSKNRNKIVFISDAILDGNAESAQVSYCGRNLINNNKRVLIENTNTLAGSCTNLLQVFHNLTRILKVPVTDAIQMLSENPAKIIGLNHIGLLKPNYRADILIFNSNLDLQNVFINGQPIPIH